MGYPLPTISEFKSRFVRDFPYSVPAFGAVGALTVVAGAITACALTKGGQGYTSEPIVAVLDIEGGGTGATITAAVDNGKVTGFTIGAGGAGYKQPYLSITGGAGDDTDLKNVRDCDIDQAADSALFNINQCLFENAGMFKTAFLLLQAHCLVENIAAATQGLNSQYNWVTQSKSVGNVSQSHAIPDRILADPFLSALSRTQYGALYLQIISPLLIGNMTTQFRQSLP